MFFNKKLELIKKRGWDVRDHIEGEGLVRAEPPPKKRVRG